MKSLLALIATATVIGTVAPTINHHQLTLTNTTKTVSNLSWKFTKTNKNIQSLTYWNNTTSVFKEQKTNKLFFINSQGEIKNTNLYNADLNSNDFTQIINDNYAIIIGGKTVNEPFQFFLVNKKYKFVDLNSFDILKNVEIINTQIIDDTHIMIIDKNHIGFLLTINNEKIDIIKLNTEVLDVKKISNNLVAILKIKVFPTKKVGITIIYDIVNNKQIQEFDDIYFADIKMFNDQNGILTTVDKQTYWVTNNNYVTLKLLDFKSTGLEFLNNKTIITEGDTLYQINIDGSFSALKHSGDFKFCTNNLGIIFNQNESSYLISQNIITNELNYTQIKINNLPISYDFATKPVVVNTNYLMFSLFTNGQSKSYVIDKTGNNIKIFLLII
ncbi:hypothetical protein [Spiroplasma sp. AdecLV25b]|uniref:hypothetical protein n=1 Tax=Spiroplasma sp. AdecLV25b TaxID=3027162 RepID=UPI0027E1699F|nr:hypothetical protein [Spiroplasma sp. AdecLV25b]